MTVVPIVLLGALVYSFTNFLRYLAGKQYGSAITQGVVWAAGIGAVYLFAETQFGSQVHIGDLPVDQFDFATRLMVGFLASSLFAAFHDVKTAIDTSQSAAVPKLVKNSPS